MMAPLIKEPSPLLHQKATPVTQISPSIQTLIDTMIETMHAAQGVGLAANQIGSPLDILVASPSGEKGGETVLINAEILESKGKARRSEGCLSVPGVFAEVSRAATVQVKALNRQGQSVEIAADGLLAQILQHEIDHLSGYLFIDRLGLFQRKKLLKRYQSYLKQLHGIKL